MKICCYCNRPIEGKAVKVSKCKNDGAVFWVHPEHEKPLSKSKQTNQGRIVMCKRKECLIANDVSEEVCKKYAGKEGGCSVVIESFHDLLYDIWLEGPDRMTDNLEFSE